MVTRKRARGRTGSRYAFVLLTFHRVGLREFYCVHVSRGSNVLQKIQHGRALYF